MAAPLPIAPLDQALTFARAQGEARPRLLAIMAYHGDTVSGFDITALAKGPDDDAIDLFLRLGYDGLRQAIEAAPAAEANVADLQIPVRLTNLHVAVGTNYPEHAEESQVQGTPFLFPKVVEPTGPWATLPAGNGLLDYEVELCLVPLSPLAPDTPATGGLILGNDVTDRAMLLRNVDLRDPQSGRGFTSGKSGPGYLPVGDLFVIPRDLKSFLSDLVLQLSVNGRERQRGPVTDWIWDLDEILRQTFARCPSSTDLANVVNPQKTTPLKRWTYWGGEARLPFDSEGAIPPRTLIMAGTPAGTIFNGIGTRDRMQGLLLWLLSGRKGPMPTRVIETYIARARKQKTYLQPGDVVSISVPKLGRMITPVGS